MTGRNLSVFSFFPIRMSFCRVKIAFPDLCSIMEGVSRLCSSSSIGNR